MAAGARQRRTVMLLTLSLLAVFLLLTPFVSFAQEVPGGEAVAAYFVLLLVVLSVPYYVYWALATQVIARKTHTRYGWLAWVPVANLILWAKIARKPIWWGLLCLGRYAWVPLINSPAWANNNRPVWWGLFGMVSIVSMVFTLLVWIAIAKARNKPAWWGILAIVPAIELIVPGYLAWSR